MNTFFSNTHFKRIPTEIISQFYQFEEVPLFTIRYGDIIILDGIAEIPFWTPRRLTRHKIVLVPCAISEIISIDRVDDPVYYDENISIGSPQNNIFQFLYTNKPESGLMKVKFSDEEFPDIDFNETFSIPTCRHYDNITKNVRKKLRNGESQEIIVRKFTGNPEQLRIRNIATMVIHQRCKYTIPQALIDFTFDDDE